MTFYTKGKDRDLGLSMLDYEATTGEYVGAMYDRSKAGTPTDMAIEYAERKRLGLTDTAGASDPLVGVPPEQSETSIDMWSVLRGDPQQTSKHDPRPRYDGATATTKAKELGFDLRFEQDVSIDEFNNTVKRKQEEAARNQIIARTPDTLRNNALGIAAGFAADLTDPINIASSFIPIVREARMAAWIARLGRGGALAARGAVEGTIGAGLLEPGVFALHKALGDDYTATESFLNVVGGGVLGGGLQLGAGKLAHALSAEGTISRWTKAITRDVPDEAIDELLKIEPKLAPKMPRTTNAGRHASMDRETADNLSGFAVNTVKDGNVPAMDAFEPIIAYHNSGDLIDAHARPSVAGRKFAEDVTGIQSIEQRRLTDPLPEAALGKYGKRFDDLMIDRERASAIADTKRGAQRLDEVEAEISRLRDQVDDEFGPDATLYKVRIRADRDKFLDLDKSLTEQSAAVKAAYKDITGIDPEHAPHKSGAEWLANLERTRAMDTNVGDLLHGAGVHGTKGLQKRTDAIGSQEFRVFDDALVEIAERNNQPLPARAIIEDGYRRSQTTKIIDGTQEMRAGDETLREAAERGEVEPEILARETVDNTKEFLRRINKEDHPMAEHLQSEVVALEKLIADSDESIARVREFDKARKAYAACMGRG
jgi:hypothetical protein